MTSAVSLASAMMTPDPGVRAPREGEPDVAAQTSKCSFRRPLPPMCSAITVMCCAARKRCAASMLRRPMSSLASVLAEHVGAAKNLGLIPEGEFRPFNMHQESARLLPA